MTIAVLKSALIFVASHIAIVTLALALFAAGQVVAQLVDRSAPTAIALLQLVRNSRTLSDAIRGPRHRRVPHRGLP